MSTLLTRIRQSVWRGNPSRHDDNASVGEIKDRATQPSACFVLIVMNTVLKCIHHNTEYRTYSTYTRGITLQLEYLFFVTVFSEETKF